MKKLLSMLLSAVLIFTMISAAGQSVFAGNSIEAVNFNSSDGAYVNTIEVAGGSTSSVDIKMPQKGIMVLFFVNGIPADCSVSVKDSKGADRGTVRLEKSSEEMNLPVYYDKAGTYTYTFSGESAGSFSLEYQAGYAPVKGTLKNNKVFYGSSPEGYAYYKINIPGNGYITVNTESMIYGDTAAGVQLTSADKKSYFKDYELFTDGEAIKMGVSKGTYYLKVSLSNPYDVYSLKYSFKSVKAMAGSSKSKAQTIKKGAVKKGIISASQKSSKADWYRFTINKTQNVDISVYTDTNMGGNTDGGIKISFYQKGKSYAFGKSVLNNEQPEKVLFPYSNPSTKKLAPGTYYIKVQKTGNCNGYYRLKWEK